MDEIIVDKSAYITGMFELFKKASKGEMVDQILSEYEKSKDDADSRDALDVALIMYHACK